MIKQMLADDDLKDKTNALIIKETRTEAIDQCVTAKPVSKKQIKHNRFLIAALQV